MGARLMPTATRVRLDLLEALDPTVPTGLERALADFYARVAPPDEADREDVGDMLAWAHRHRRIDGQPFSLDRFTPLVEVYRDDHPRKVLIKPAQRGCSELAVNLTCYALEHGATAWAPHKDGLNVGYVFPTAKALGDFSKERLSGLKDETDHLRDLFTSDDWNAVTFKQVGRSYLYLRGGQSEDELRSFAADLLVLDEFDRMDRRAVALARRRLNASEVKRELALSTPSLPGRGIHALWQQSDRRLYEQPCPRCGDWHRYEFHRDVRVDGQPWDAWKDWEPGRIRAGVVALTCPSCREAIGDAGRCAPGRWVAEAPEVTSLRGYWIPPLAFPFVDLVELAVAAVTDDPSELEEFFRSDLGLPYETKGGRITREMLQRLSADLDGGELPRTPAWVQTVMGVDVGARFHYEVASSLPGDDRPYVREKGSVASWEELDRLMTGLRVRSCVVDALPEIHGARAFADRHTGKVLLATYPGPAALQGQLYRTTASDALRTSREARRRIGAAVDDPRDDLVQVNRTAAMDRVYAAVAGGREHWPRSVHDDREVVAHMTAPIRSKRTGKDGQEVAEWVHTAPDHGFHASVYRQIARLVMPAAPAAPGALAMGAARGW